MSTKYKIQNLRKWTLDRLEEYVPYSRHLYPAALLHYSEHPSDTLRMINIGRECDAKEYLPLAFYHLAMKGTRDSIPQEPADRFDYKDIQRVYLGRIKLQEMWWENFVQQSTDLNPREGCEGYSCVMGGSYRPRTTCAAGVAAVEAGSRDPLTYLFSEEARCGEGCKACMAMHVALCRSALDAMWNGLGEIFSL